MRGRMETVRTVYLDMPADEAREILGHLEDDIEVMDPDYLKTERGKLVVELTNKLRGLSCG